MKKNQTNLKDMKRKVFGLEPFQGLKAKKVEIKFSNSFSGTFKNENRLIFFGVMCPIWLSLLSKCAANKKRLKTTVLSDTNQALWCGIKKLVS